MRLVGLIYVINKPVVALVELRRAVEMLSGSEWVSWVHLLDKYAGCCVGRVASSCRAVEMLCGSE